MLIKVKVFPKSKKQEVVKKADDAFEIKIKEMPERGLANKATAQVLADYFNISVKKVRLIKGAKQRNKIYEIYS